MRGKIVSIETGGEVAHHMAGGSGADYATACGMDGNDLHFSVDQKTVETPKGAKINCRQCWNIFIMAREYRRTDFDVKEITKWKR